MAVKAAPLAADAGPTTKITCQRSIPLLSGNFPCVLGCREFLKYSGQLRALCPAPVIPIDWYSFRAIASDLIQPIDNLGIAATVIDQAAQAIAASPATLVTGHPQHIERVRSENMIAPSRGIARWQLETPSLQCMLYVSSLPWVA
jgi:hypothetical protein